MRTKTLLLAAAISAAGIAASLAQSNVYSLNVVGYVNIALAAGQNLIANPLDVDGTGTNNNLTTVFGNQVQGGEIVSAFNGASYDSATYSAKLNVWQGPNLPAVNAGLQPGKGAFVFVGTATNVTVVGNVLQGQPLTQQYAAGFSILSSKVPQTGLLATDLKYGPAGGDIVQKFNSGTQNYISPAATYSAKLNAWANPPGEPTINVGEGFFLFSSAGGTWTRNFTVQ